MVVLQASIRVRPPPVFSRSPFDSLWEERHKPPPHSGYGLDGLMALQEYQQQRYGVPLNFLDDWQNQIDHLLAMIPHGMLYRFGNQIINQL